MVLGFEPTTFTTSHNHQTRATAHRQAIFRCPSKASFNRPPPPPLVWFLASVRIFFKKDNKKVLNSTKIKFVLGSFFNPSIDRRREEKIWIAIFFSWPPSSPLYHRKSNLFVHSMEASFGIRLKSFPLKGNSNNNKNDAKYWTASGICFCAGIQCKLSGRQNTSVAIFECCHIGIRYQVIF